MAPEMIQKMNPKMAVYPKMAIHGHETEKKTMTGLKKMLKWRKKPLKSNLDLQKECIKTLKIHSGHFQAYRLRHTSRGWNIDFGRGLTETSFQFLCNTYAFGTKKRLYFELPVSVWPDSSIFQWCSVIFWWYILGGDRCELTSFSPTHRLKTWNSWFWT